MEMVFTKNIGKFRKGEVRDFPRSTWNRIARNSNNEISNFAKTINELSVSNSKKQVDLKNPIPKRQ